MISKNGKNNKETKQKINKIMQFEGDTAGQFFFHFLLPVIYFYYSSHKARADSTVWVVKRHHDYKHKPIWKQMRCGEGNII